MDTVKEKPSETIKRLKAEVVAEQQAWTRAIESRDILRVDLAMCQKMLKASEGAEDEMYNKGYQSAQHAYETIINNKELELKIAKAEIRLLRLKLKAAS